MSQSDFFTKMCANLITGLSKREKSRPSKTLHIDGVSCTYKTTIANKLIDRVTKKEKHQCNSLYKVQARNPSYRTNSSLADAIGYVYAGSYDDQIQSACKDMGDRIADRDPTNNLLWDTIWRLFGIYEIKNHLKLPYEEFIKTDDGEQFIQYARCTFKNFRETFYAYELSKYNVLAIIDTDTNLIRERLVRRDEGSDKFRGQNWDFYIPLQNEAYSIVYEDTFIDLKEIRQIVEENEKELSVIFFVTNLAQYVLEFLNTNVSIYKSFTTCKIPTFKVVLYSDHQFRYTIEAQVRRSIAKIMTARFIDACNCNEHQKTIIQLKRTIAQELPKQVNSVVGIKDIITGEIFDVEKTVC